MLRQALGLSPRSDDDSANPSVAQRRTGSRAGQTGRGRNQSSGVPEGSQQNGALSGPARSAISTRSPGMDPADDMVEQPQRGAGDQTTGTGRSVPGAPEQATAATESARSQRLSEISDNNLPAWQKLQRIAELARHEAARRSISSSEGSEDSPGSPTTLTRKLQNLLQKAAGVTAESVSELPLPPRESRRSSGKSASSRRESRGRLRQWATSVNQWLAELPEDDDTLSENTAEATATEQPVTDETGRRPAVSFWLLLVALAGGAAWWLLRGRYLKGQPDGLWQAARHERHPDGSERDRFIQRFHELVRQPPYGTEVWWNHAQAVREISRRQPQIAGPLQSVAAVYERLRYAPDSELSADELAAASDSLERCRQP